MDDPTPTTTPALMLPPEIDQPDLWRWGPSRVDASDWLVPMDQATRLAWQSSEAVWADAEQARRAHEAHRGSMYYRTFYVRGDVEEHLVKDVDGRQVADYGPRTAQTDQQLAEFQRAKASLPATSLGIADRANASIAIARHTTSLHPAVSSPEDCSTPAHTRHRRSLSCSREQASNNP